MNKNFGLTLAEFELLLEEVQAGDNTRFEQVFLAHFNDCINYLKSNYDAKQEDAYDATMETLIIFHDRMKEGKVTYGNLRFLFTQIASQYYLRWIKKEQLTQTLPETLDRIEANAQLDRETLGTLDKAWAQLGQKCQDLLKAFYYGNVKLNELALIAESSPAAVRKQKQRCVEQLRSLFQQFS